MILAVLLITLIVVLTLVGYYKFHEYNSQIRESIISHGNNISSNKIDIPTYYINLDKSEDRRNNLLDQFQRYSPSTSLTRIPAVTGEYEQNKLTKGEVGCYLSHMKAIQTAYNNGDQWSLILEDDAELILIPYWKYTLSELVSRAPDDCGIIQLYYYNRVVENEKNTFVPRTSKDYSTAAYIISRKAMEYHLNNFNGEIRNPIDIEVYKLPNLTTYITSRYYFTVNESQDVSTIGNRYSLFIKPFRMSSRSKIYNRNMGKFVLNVDVRGYIDPLFKYILEKAVNKPVVYNCKDIPYDITLADVLRNCTYDHRIPHITISGESQRCTNQEAVAHIVSSSPTTPKDIYIPYGIRIVKDDIIEVITKKKFKKIHERKYGVAYVNSNCTSNREEIYKKLVHKISNSHALGKCNGGVPSAVEITSRDNWNSNYKYLQDYRFIIAMENKEYPGYLTEKIVNAFAAGAIPIYYGDRETVEKYFNKEAYINVSDFENLESCVDYVSKLTDVELQRMQDLQVIRNPEVFEYSYYDSVAKDLRNRLIEAGVSLGP